MSDAAAQQNDTPKVIDDSDTIDQTQAEKEFDEAARDISRHQSSDKLSMEIKVSSPFKTYFEGTAFSLTAENETGIFDVLPKHHNFISLLRPCSLEIRTTKGEERKIEIGGGMMHVKADKVIVFLDI